MSLYSYQTIPYLYNAVLLHCKQLARLQVNCSSPVGSDFSFSFFPGDPRINFNLFHCRKPDLSKHEQKMENIQIQVNLYGKIARKAGGRHIARLSVTLPPGAAVSDLLANLGITDQERGYLFVNAVLCEVPGISTGGAERLNDGDHVGIFSLDHMWPYQYRDGVPMSASLKQTLSTQDSGHGAMRHTYEKAKTNG